MASTGLLRTFALTGMGSKGVVLSGDELDLILDRLNLLSAPMLNPMLNFGQFYVAGNGLTLDLTPLQQQMANITTRLDSASANVNCVGNTVTVTFHI